MNYAIVAVCVGVWAIVFNASILSSERRKKTDTKPNSLRIFAESTGAIVLTTIATTALFSVVLFLGDWYHFGRPTFSTWNHIVFNIFEVRSREGGGGHDRSRTTPIGSG